MALKPPHTTPPGVLRRLGAVTLTVVSGKGMPRIGVDHHLDVLVVLFGSVSKVKIAAPMVLIYKGLFPSISTFETPPIAVS
jgi:hypothetical protein